MDLPVSSRKRWPRRVRTPTVLQMEAVECGAASLAIMLEHYGRTVPLTELRRECGVSRDGSKASNVLKAARRYGMKAKGFSKSLAALKDLDPPYIVFWHFNHFLVVEGFSKDTVYLSDPSTGHRKVTREEFDEGYTGVVLVLEPGPEFEKGGARPSLFSALRERLRGAYGAIAFCMLAGLLLVIPGLLIPALSQVFLDHVLIQNREEWLRPLVAGILGVAFVHGSLTFLRMRYLRRMRLSLSARMSAKFFWHLIRLPASFYSQRFAGEITNRSQLNAKIADALSGKLATTAIDTVMMVFYAALMFFYDAVLTWIGIGFALVNFLVLRLVGRKRVELNMRVLDAAGKASGQAIAGLQSIETLKSSGQEDGFFSRWAGAFTKATNAGHEATMTNVSLGGLPALLTPLASMLVLIVGGYRVIDGTLTIGMLVAFQSLMSSFLRPVNTLVDLGGTIQELRGDLVRLDDVIAHPADPLAPAEPVEEAIEGDEVRLGGAVELRKVCFGYSPLDAPLIADFDLQMAPGQRVAFVGGSGSGKSTLARVLCGLYPAWSGEILFDGRRRDQVPRGVMHNSLALVDQDIVLFGGTIRDNLTLWDSTVPEAQIVRACEDAEIYDVVLGVPGGLDGELTEGGGNLSGGQRQRLELARALVNNPSILVLDEATSALDAETERAIFERLRLRGCSCILVAHRLSTIRDCDEIIVLRGGQVAERGTHEALWAAGGAYASLLAADQSALKQAAG